MIGQLPTGTVINGKKYEIRTDYRDILKIACAFNDPELEDAEKVYTCLVIFYPDFKSLKREEYDAAFKAALDFIDCGSGTEDKTRLHIMDWEQDEKLLFPAINRVAGCEVRNLNYLHWWTFVGYYMEISDGVFSNVLSLRAKKARGKKLEKWEREYWSNNKDICVLKPKLTKEEQEEKERLKKMLDGE